MDPEYLKAFGFPIIGIHGRKGSGKSTFAESIGEEVPHIRVAFADALRDVSKAVFGSDYRTQAEKSAHDAFWAERLGEDWGTGRKILQRLGSEVFRDHLHKDIWLMVMERRLAALFVKHGHGAKPVVTIEDVRYPAEASFVHDLGGRVIEIVNINLPPNNDPHSSEQPLPSELIDQSYVCSSSGEVRGIAKSHLFCMRGYF